MRSRIVQELRRSGDWISGQGLSHRLGISRSAISKHIAALRLQGYDIVSMPRRGHRLLGAPDRLYGAEIQPLLHTARLGHGHLHHRRSTGSTNADARRLAQKGAPDGTLVVAEKQTEGRGRKGRDWYSPAGKGVYASLILRPTIPLEETPTITLAAAVALVEAIDAVSGCTPTIKWPNDILINGRKVAGLLTELSCEMDRVDFIILGVGLNVNVPRKEFPEGFRYPASSLLAETGTPYSRAELLAAWMNCLEPWMDSLQAHGASRIISRWQHLANIVGRDVTIDRGRDSVRGRVTAIGPDGALIVEDRTGTPHHILSGDVVLHD